MPNVERLVLSWRLWFAMSALHVDSEPQLSPFVLAEVASANKYPKGTGPVWALASRNRWFLAECRGGTGKGSGDSQGLSGT